ncbi:CHAT domain-containing protein [Ephemerocybe angulata]|uniref:CHAT domain-containing protein n=1 Tax=Ephemerocybe angulata TaxID=980116 RepID=A0A8H6LZV4_9AGAR|nr:CHAT domain-containing protein [Tulosesus angulatus]
MEHRSSLSTTNETPVEAVHVPDDLGGRLHDQGIEHLCNFKRTGELSALTEATKFLQQAVPHIPHGHPELPALLNNLGNAFTCHYEVTGKLTEINEAILMKQKAVDLTPKGHPDLPRRLNNLGNSFARRFERTSELADITAAILVHQKALDLTPKGDTNLPARLSNLGSSFACRFNQTAALADISRAVALRREATDLVPRGHPNLPDLLNNLGTSLTGRFEQTGELSDISDAISAQQRAVDLTLKGHPQLPCRLNNLGGSFIRRFERTDDLSDLTEAISLRQKAVNITPAGHADLPLYLHGLGSALSRRFVRTKQLADISRAITALKTAVDITPHGHPSRPARLNNLGNTFNYRFEQTREPTDVSEAVSLHQKAVDLTPAGYSNLPTYIGNLAHSLTSRFELMGEHTDVSNATLLRQRALGLTPVGHSDLPRRQFYLGETFYNRFTSSGDLGDLESSLSMYKASATSNVGPPRDKLDAATRWARRLIQHHPQSPEIVHAFDTAICLVALIAGLEQTVRGRHTQLERTSGLALEAAAAACALGRPEKALEWLEQGRCLVWNQLNNLRTPLDDLRIRDENLAQSIADTSKALEHAGSSRHQAHADMPLSKKIVLEDEARAHLDLARKWDGLLKTARAIPGFESFLVPSPCSTLMQHLPESGPIVLINVDDRRCDAFALLAGLDKPVHIPLPNFSIEKASTYRTVFVSQLRIHSLRSREVEPRGVRPAPIGKRGEDVSVHRVLRGLFEEVVKPILDALGFSKFDRTAADVLPRLWWCPTGALSFLPLHAAGIYRGPNQESVNDYAVSSYTPTITALTDRVKNHRLVGSTASGLFLTSQPSVDGAPPIPGTTKEVRSIYERAKESGVDALKLEGDDMTVAQCLEHMQAFSCIHLACHGSQNAAEPLQSRFLFHQGSLELGTILKSNLEHADLAFLSACQTSTGKETLSDEAVHLAAGMLAAGYRRVVGTMWSIGDKPAQDVATMFYDHLFARQAGTGGTAFNGAQSALALHHATQQLRLSLDDSEKSLLTWIPFVHFGV